MIANPTPEAEAVALSALTRAAANRAAAAGLGILATPDLFTETRHV